MDDIYQAPLYKRVISSILDVLVTVLLSIGLFMLLTNGVIDIGFHNLSYKLNQYKLQEESGLFYVEKNSDNSYKNISLLTYDEKNKDSYKSFVNTINNYYFTYENSPEKSEAFFNEKYMLFDKNTCKNPIFSINSMNDGIEKYTLLDDVLDVSTNKTVNKSDEENYYKAIMNFFMDSNKGVYNLALTEFTNSENFQSLVTRLETIETIEALICVSFSALVFLTIPSILNKNGETPFMYLFGICFSDSYGYKVKWKHKIIRGVVILLLYAASTYLFAIPLVINAIICLATGQKRSIVDFASNMTAIDRKTSVIIDDKDLVESK